jgi:hypothetical protein
MVRNADPTCELTVSEADLIDFAGGSLAVSFPGSPVPLRVSVRDEGTGIGEIGFDGSRVSFSGEPIGVLRGVGEGPAAAALRIELSARATTAAVEALIENLRLADLSGTLAVRTALVTLTDGGGRSATVPFALQPASPPPRPPVPRPACAAPAAEVGAGVVLADAESDGFVFATSAGS